EAQREKEKTNSCNSNRGCNPPRKGTQCPICPAEKCRCDKEEIDRHVGKDHERNEWNGVFALKAKNIDAAASRCDPIADAVHDQEQDRQSRGNSEGCESPS